MVREQQVIISEGTTEPLLAVWYQPKGPANSCVVMCAPIFEERKASHRPLVELARALAAAGVTVLRFDYRGCGDSAGELADYAPNDWLKDIHGACRFLRDRSADLPVGLFGLRVGASLAVEVAAHADQVEFLLLWQPVVNGRDYLQEELRKTLMKQLLTFGGAKMTREHMINRLESGYTVDFDGYSLTPRIYKELCGINLQSAVKGLRVPVCMSEFTPGGEPSEPGRKLAALLLEMDIDFTHTALKHQPFWNLLGHVDCAGAAEAAIEWMAEKGWAIPTAVKSGTMVKQGE